MSTDLRIHILRFPQFFKEASCPALAFQGPVMIILGQQQSWGLCHHWLPAEPLKSQKDMQAFEPLILKLTVSSEQNTECHQKQQDRQKARSIKEIVKS